MFQAIADPTRRQIINIISRQSLNVNAVAENFDVSGKAFFTDLPDKMPLKFLSSRVFGRGLVLLSYQL